jgi:serine/threonine protein kinase
MGIGENSHVCYLVDMGLAKRVFDPITGQHIKFKTDNTLTGTASYASIHAHLGEELSRRDDLEAIGYVLIYFLKGTLPWQNLPAFSKSEKYNLRKLKKQQTSIE